MTQYAFSTLGCRLNRTESDSMAEELKGLGWRPAQARDHRTSSS
ncbi:MAG: hypothetical protein M3198_15100 [Actinomycetota bacterium]|nr:hypothetical protein [Actinomycetota bacterium]